MADETLENVEDVSFHKSKEDPFILSHQVS